MSLRKWVQEKWVDIGSKRKDGSYAPCGRSKGEKRNARLIDAPHLPEGRAQQRGDAEHGQRLDQRSPAACPRPPRSRRCGRLVVGFTRFPRNSPDFRRWIHLR